LIEELNRLGYVEGENVVLDCRQYARFDEAGQEVRDLVRSSPDVLVAYGTPVARAAIEATSTIPIVFAVRDPVEAGSWEASPSLGVMPQVFP
jgi:putative tryptophan/tyrosine transport system substrate-binding protein